MKRFFSKPLFFFCCLFTSITLIAQTSSLNGNIKSSSTNESISAVSVMVKGTTLGTFTDDKGNFKISGNLNFPLTLVVTSVGYTSKEVEIASAGQSIKITLEPSSALAQEVVVSASRLPERILESPVSIERVSAANIRNSAASNYYDMIGNLKGIDMITASLNFKTPSSRGFNGSGNLRMNQLIDGMDNQAPGLNFAVGSMVGPSELDVDNMELLNGASSALYGPGGMNGTLLISTKNPFKYQGLSVQVKQGIMHLSDNERSSSGYNDIALRYGRVIGEKFAFKIAGQFINAKDWVGQDYRNFNRGTNPAKGDIIGGDRISDPNYNGVNVYGDETSGDLRPIIKTITQLQPQSAAFLNQFLAAPFMVSRTGFKESDIIDPTTQNIRVTAAVHYKLSSTIEASLSANYGTGTTVYTGSDRYNFKDLKMGQYKLELKHKNWFVRAYTTLENAGKSFNATATTQLYNESWKRSLDTSSAAATQASWFPQYVGAFAQAAGTVFQQAYTAALQSGQTQAQAVQAGQAAVAANTGQFHNVARSFADQGMPAVGSALFNRLFDSVASRSISNGGGLFIDKSSLNMFEGQYNLSDVVKVADVLVGANLKQYLLNSDNTIFFEPNGKIKINEIGAYALVSKKLFKDVLKLTASGRYDKNTNFKGRFTPRFSAVITPAKDHNIRLSYQTAYRFPSTQNQWINLVIGGGVRLLGGLPQLRDNYNFNTNPVYTPESVIAFSQSVAGGNPNPNLLVKQSFGEYKPESATSYEIGYKTLINKKLLIDVYAYYAKYQNFIGRTTVLQSSDGTLAGLSNYKIYSVSVNTSDKVNTQGWGISGEYLLPRNFTVNGNLFMDEIKNVPSGFVTYYNTPKMRANLGLTNTGILFKKRLGFSLQYRYQDGYRYESDFGSAYIPSFATLDAQVNYKFPSIKSIIKLGGTNITNQYYVNGYGNPAVGGLYYVSFGYNVF